MNHVFKCSSIKISSDGEHWIDITEAVIYGSIYIYHPAIDDVEEIAPDNPLYDELVTLLEGER